MATQITLTLSERAYSFAEELAKHTGRSIQETLSAQLEDALGTWVDAVEPDLSALADEEVLALADSQMDALQGETMSDLLNKQQAGTITAQETVELQLLMRIYEVGTLRKAQGLAEAVKRGLRPRGPW